MHKKTIDFDDYLKTQLKNVKFKKEYQKHGKQLEISYQILQLRKRAGISQIELANKIGTTQSNVARFETGNQNFTTEMLVKIATALKKDLKVEFV
ncbi:helix-turn-helix transcriptional regulator [Candidatus Uhrbacteria bacterium]|nr:helix-turn-helix transcriptional regulator [Candidatus Uhrbacteria bacterium]